MEKKIVLSNMFFMCVPRKMRRMCSVSMFILIHLYALYGLCVCVCVFSTDSYVSRCVSVFSCLWVCVFNTDSYVRSPLYQG